MPDNPTLRVMESLFAARSIDEAWRAATNHFASLGFSRINYGLSRHQHGAFIGDLKDILFLSTLKEPELGQYLHNGHFQRTPQFRWLLTNVGASTWRWTDEDLVAGRLSPDEVLAQAYSHKMGIYAGVTISFPYTSPRQRGGMGMIADPGLGHDDVDRIWGQHGAEITVLADYMHLKLAALPWQSSGRELTPRQREALEWVADGKTSQDIATLMGISAAMVEKHLRLARQALDVDTTAQAICKAVLLNMLFVDGCPKAQLETP